MNIPRIPRKYWLFFLILGPGLITSFADNDAGGIATYSVAGASYGYRFLWVLFLITILLALVQEMSARLGVVTGKGLSDLIREKFGVRWTFFAMLALLVANFATIISNFSGIAASFEIFGILKYLSVPLMALFIWFLILRGSYKFVERIFLLLCLLFFSYVVSGILAGPDWGLAIRHTLVPHFIFEPGVLMLFIAFIGTTITPWMQFYLQSSVVDKGLSVKQYKYIRLEVVLGAFFTDFISFFIIIACAATLFRSGVRIETAQDAALALRPLAGGASSILFALGLLGASTLASFILPLTTSYAVCEAFGFENGLNKKISEAPIFYSLISILIFLGAAVVLLPHLPLIPLMLTAQLIQGILLPVVLVFMLLLLNDRRLMGEYVNSRIYNLAIGLLVAVLISASAALVVLPFIR